MGGTPMRGAMVALILALSVYGVIIAVFSDLPVDLKTKPTEPKPVFAENVGDLKIEIFDVKLTEDEDDGKIIVNIPVTLTNKSDHAFVFSVPHFDYNETNYVFTMFALDEGDVGGKIKRGDTKRDTITVKLDTRDKTEVKTIQPTFSIYDMKTEKRTEFKPDITVQ
jgi:hypothetical protein